MQPGAVLASLLTLGAVVGVWCWSLSKKATPPASHFPADKTVVTEPDPSALAPETMQAAEIVRDSLPAKEVRLKELQKENTGLRKELAKLQGAEIPESPGEHLQPGRKARQGFPRLRQPLSMHHPSPLRPRRQRFNRSRSRWKTKSLRSRATTCVCANKWQTRLPRKDRLPR